MPGLAGLIIICFHRSVHCIAKEWDLLANILLVLDLR